ncbi:MAG: RagB/SusD family nutrient uptake outer membrane protein, partial [Phaeodactylibacter sp.]|nr:RagB/SusD family nutrient uptake outer membrane protein [Phaeodactylibacter sp.]
MYKHIRGMLLLAGIFLLAGCKKDFLEITPTDRIISEQVWSDANLIELYVNKLYQGLPHGFERHLWSKYCDEAYGDDTWLMGNWNADNITGFGQNSNWIDYFSQGYKYIRECNIFFEEISEAETSDERKVELSAEVRFIRAYVYANLLWRYGGVPIVEEVYELTDEVKFSRNSYDEVLDYIIAELDKAMPDLAAKYEPGDGNFGRATQHAALALKSRLYLYAASELQNPSGDLAKWQLAADAAKAVIDLNAYTLEDSYGEAFLDVNNEQIFVRSFSESNGHLVTFLNTNHTLGGWGGWGGRNAPSQNLVDDYEMANGELPFLADGTVNPASGYDPQNPYVDRDPRFYETIIFQGDVFRADARPADKPEYDVSQESSGLDGEGNPVVTGSVGIDNYKVNGDNSRTSYSMKKFIDRSKIISRSAGGYSQPWIFFRLGEIYLNYAEAMYELGMEGEARTYVNLVRERAGQPELSASLSGPDLLDRIRHERRIELAFEGHRFFDVRRWKTAPEVESQNIRV